MSLPRLLTEFCLSISCFSQGKMFFGTWGPQKKPHGAVRDHFPPTEPASFRGSKVAKLEKYETWMPRTMTSMCFHLLKNHHSETCWSSVGNDLPGVGNEPEGHSLKESHRGWVCSSFPAYRTSKESKLLMKTDSRVHRAGPTAPSRKAEQAVWP